MGRRQVVMALMSWADKCFRETLNWLLLSNSGEPLKLMIPSHSRKAMSGQINYLGTVISHKMIEKEMGNRGSKSEFVTDSVKEQRVDGSYCNYLLSNSQLRCTLMGFERNYHIKIPSKQLNKSYFSTLSYNQVVNPWFITGFSDAEGCFSVLVKPDAKLKTKWRVSPLFTIQLHVKDLAILEAIKKRLSITAKPYIDKTNSAKLKTVSFASIQKIVSFLDKTKAKLRGYKRLQYLLFLKELRTNPRYKKLNIPNNYGKNQKI